MTSPTIIKLSRCPSGQSQKFGGQQLHNSVNTAIHST